MNASAAQPLGGAGARFAAATAPDAPQSRTNEPLPPPPDDAYGVVPWDPPQDAQPARLPPHHDVSAFGVRLRGRTAGLVDGAYSLGRTVRDHPFASATVVGAAVALEIVASPIMLALCVSFVAVSAVKAVQAEYRAATARDPDEREKYLFESGHAIFGIALGLPIGPLARAPSKPATPR